ncbi:hypothetical protein N7539_009471 [Penicillium diatomitis]|uniref:Uncharacterized protein n=1 Tax=Penicillium diatomitis TaxID=2819901 RepID=A0A9W9WKL3_9EURO|nr:uncharacterized protein N7539_009471 [Penicillium diatomitis]KAJ5466742.1 hypothetical protein N7539_009471 [Penicillium diatomitis]
MRHPRRERGWTARSSRGEASDGSPRGSRKRLQDWNLGLREGDRQRECSKPCVVAQRVIQAP